MNVKEGTKEAEEPSASAGEKRVVEEEVSVSEELGGARETAGEAAVATDTPVLMPAKKRIKR